MRIPTDALEPATLRRVVEEYVTREGTEYGRGSTELDTKVDQVLRQLQKGDALLVFDPEAESCDIIPKSHPHFAVLARGETPKLEPKREFAPQAPAKPSERTIQWD